MMGIITLAAFTAVACGGSVATPTVGKSPEAQSTVAPGPGAGTRSAVSPESLAQSPAFLAHFQSYWYSLSNLGHLTSRSGLGVRLIPTDDQIAALREMAGITQGPANAFLVQALYSSGDPSFVRPYDGNENDFANFRWDQSKMDRTVTPQAMGYAMIKEVIWAKSFATDVEGPSPLNHFRALTLSTEAAAQARFAAKHLISGDGLLVHGWKDDQVTDSSTRLQDQMVMLWALSELSDYATGKYGWYADPLSHEEAVGMADALVARGGQLRGGAPRVPGRPAEPRRGGRPGSPVFIH